MAKMMVSFSRLIYRKTLMSVLLTFLAHFDESQLSFVSCLMRNAGGKKLGGGVGGVLQPTTSKELRPFGSVVQDELSLANNHMSELGCGSYQLNLKLIGNKYLNFSFRIGSKFTPRFLTHENHKKMYVCCFKLLNLGFFCYATIDN